ncbi:MAG: hypothetical protein ACYTDY_08810 [Planctomycetota bacterium]
MRKQVFTLALIPAVVLAAYALTRTVLATEEDDCDMKTVIAGYYCEPSDLLLEKKELVSDVTYYECSFCELITKAEGKCPDCEKALVKKTSGKNVCPKCYEKPLEAEICVRTCYECPECCEQVAEAGECKECEEKLAQITVRALIQYQCPETDCDEASYKPAKCQNKECDHHGKPLVKTCSESGVFPHVKEKPKTKTKAE